MDARLLLELPMPPQPASSPSLTERDLATLHCLAADLSYAQMARQLGISEQGVSARIQRLYAKVRLHSRVHVVVWAIQHQIIDPAQITLAHVEGDE